MTMLVYECRTQGCSLGSLKSPGRFSGGATKEQITALTGDPDPEHYGDGVCANCGEVGKEIGQVPEPHEGNDPYQELHDKVAEAVADPDNDKVTADNAQAVLETMVAKVEGDDNAH